MGGARLQQGPPAQVSGLQGGCMEGGAVEEEPGRRMWGCLGQRRPGPEMGQGVSVGEGHSRGLKKL